MNATVKAFTRTTSCAMALAVALPALAALPHPKMENGISYLSGGVGRDQALAMEKAERHYPLSMVFSAGKRGAFLADVNVTIKNKAGKTLLDTNADGPIMLVQLPAGDYSIDARAEGRTLHRIAKVASKGDTNVSFNWPRA